MRLLISLCFSDIPGSVELVHCYFLVVLLLLLGLLLGWLRRLVRFRIDRIECGGLGSSSVERSLKFLISLCSRDIQGPFAKHERVCRLLGSCICR